MDNQTNCTELESWKEIAGYLGVTIRTAQNWERDRGLPVQRRLGKHGRIFAQAGEIDAWKRQVTSSATDADAPESSTSGSTPPPSAALGRWCPRGATLVALCLVLILFGAGVALYRIRGGPQPARYLLDRNSLVVLGQEGRELWQKDFGNFSTESGQGDHAGPGKVFMQDVDYDGETEVVLSVTGTRDDAPEGELICLSATGSSKWTFRTRESMGGSDRKPEEGRSAVNFALADFGRPVGKAFVVVVDYPDNPQIALVSPQDGHLMKQTTGASNPGAAAAIMIPHLDQLFE